MIDLLTVSRELDCIPFAVTDFRAWIVCQT